MTLIALLGAKALWLTYIWLASAIVASYLSGRKGYGERAGLASGLLLNFVGVVIWLVIPAKQDSHWKKLGPVGRGRATARPGRTRGEDTGGAEPPPTAPAA
jgi:hypothetical protein